jgi:hypothetical protein
MEESNNEETSILSSPKSKMFFILYQHVTANVTAAEASPGSCNRFLLTSAKAVKVFSPRGNPIGTD